MLNQQPETFDRRALWLLPAAATILLSAIALQEMSFVLTWATLVGAWITCFTAPLGIRAITNFRWGIIPLFAVLCIWWFADFNAPHQWDAVQTTIRADLFWRTGHLERASIFYPIIAPFVVFYRHTNIPSHLAVMLMGVGTIAATSMMTTVVAGRRWGWRAAILAPLLAPLFLLYRWVMLDTLLVMVWALTLWATLAWGRNLTRPRIVIIVLLTILTVSSKEMGALIIIPVLGSLLAFANRRQRRARIVIAAIVVVCAVLISFVILRRYAELKGITNYFQELVYSDRGLTFIVAQKGKLPEPLRHYLKAIIRMNLSFWIQAGFLVPITFALFRPVRKTAGVVILIVGACVQLAWMFGVARVDLWSDIFTYPMFDGMVTGHSFYIVAIYFAVVAAYWALRQIRLAITRTTAVLLLAILPGYILLHCFVKAYSDDHTLHLWVAWHYLVVLFASAIPLAMHGLRRIGKLRLKRPLTYFLMAVATMTIMNGLLQSLGMALNFRILNMARMDAYHWMEKQPERVVYTHWPFMSADAATSNFDNGPLAWETDGWKVSGLYQFQDDSVTPGEPSLFLYGTYRNYGLPMQRFPKIADPACIVRVNRWRPGLFSFTMEQEPIDAIVVRRFPGEYNHIYAARAASSKSSN